MNPTGTDDGEAILVDLQTTLAVIVYDDAKTYYDFTKGAARFREVAEQILKRQRRARHPASSASYRALGETRTVNGIACTMYERVVGGRADGQVCLAPWNGPIGAREDFAWLLAFMKRVMLDVAGEAARSLVSSLEEEKPGFAVWESSAADDGRRDVQELLKISRDPLPAAMFRVPADYKEFSRPLTASERPKVAAPRPEDVSVESASRRPWPRFSGLRAILLAIGLLFGLFVGALFLHLAARIVLEHPRFTQALVAIVINAVALTAFELIPLPPLLTLAFGAFGVFAGLKISYGASAWRTVALVVVSIVLTTLFAWRLHGIFHFG